MSSMIRTNNLRYYSRKEKTEMKYKSSRLSLNRARCGIFRLSAFILSLYLLTGPIIASTYSVCSNNPTFKNADEPTRLFKLNLTWTSRRSVNPTPLSAGDRIAGDHIVLKAEWQPAKDINWTHLVVNASAIPAVIEKETQTNVAELDTRFLGNNATCIINVTTGLKNGSLLNEVFPNVFLGNFFEPSVVVKSPNGGEIWTGIENISWQAWDLNVEEPLTYEVLLSSDYNKTPQLLSSGLAQNWLEWDFSELVNSSSYKIIVRVTDGIYTSTDTSDGYFTAGLIHPTTTSAITPTTTTMTEYDIRVVGFLVALTASSILIALVAYYRAKKL
jgi:hypothetical protein